MYTHFCCDSLLCVIANECESLVCVEYWSRATFNLLLHARFGTRANVCAHQADRQTTDRQTHKQQPKSTTTRAVLIQTQNTYGCWHFQRFMRKASAAAKSEPKSDLIFVSFGHTEKDRETTMTTTMTAGFHTVVCTSLFAFQSLCLSYV